MTMKEEMERLRGEITAANEAPKVEEEAAEAVADEVEDTADVDDAEDGSGKEEAAAEEKKEEPKKEEPKAEVDNATYARMRWEAAEERRKREELEKRLEAIEKGKADTAKDTDPEPDKSTDFEAWVDWKDRQLEKKVEEVNSRLNESSTREQERLKQEDYNKTVKAAVDEFTAYEDGFKARVSDYEDVSAFYLNKLKDSVKTLYPAATDAQIGQMVTNKILQTAGTYAANGLNPVERMYQDAKAMGYSAPVKKEEPKKSNLAAIDKNKRRSASVAATAGDNGKNSVGLSDVSDMSMAEFSKLTPEERTRLKREANGG